MDENRVFSVEKPGIRFADSFNRETGFRERDQVPYTEGPEVSHPIYSAHDCLSILSTSATTITILISYLINAVNKRL